MAEKENIRCFVAIPVPESIRPFLRKASAGLKNLESFRTTAERNWHVTLLFLGDVRADRISALKSDLAAVAERHEPFEMQIDTTGPGPNPRNPRLIWAKFHRSEAFLRLVYDLRDTLAAYNQLPEDREPRPHITLGRFRKHARPSQNLEVREAGERQVLPVRFLELWQSDTKPTGAEYSALASFALGVNAI